MSIKVLPQGWLSTLKGWITWNGKWEFVVVVVIYRAMRNIHNKYRAHTT